MPDHLTPQQRHANMATIRSKNTKPEMIVRRGLWKRGFRYRLNHIYLQDHSVAKPYEVQEEESGMLMAAEEIHDSHTTGIP